MRGEATFSPVFRIIFSLKPRPVISRRPQYRSRCSEQTKQENVALFLGCRLQSSLSDHSGDPCGGDRDPSAPIVLQWGPRNTDFTSTQARSASGSVGGSPVTTTLFFSNASEAAVLWKEVSLICKGTEAGRGARGSSPQRRRAAPELLRLLARPGLALTATWETRHKSAEFGQPLGKRQSAGDAPGKGVTGGRLGGTGTDPE